MEHAEESRQPRTRVAARHGQLHRAPQATARLTAAPRSRAMEYTFTLKYQLADGDRDADALVERLGESGCDDALVGIGQPGRLALQVRRCAARWLTCGAPCRRPG